MSGSTVKVILINTPTEDTFAIKENGYLKSLRTDLKESIRVGKNAAVALSNAYLPITVDITNPEQRLYTIYSTPNNTFKVLPDDTNATLNYTATIDAGSYSEADLMSAVEHALNFRTPVTRPVDDVMVGLDWNVDLNTDDKTTITFSRWEQTDPDAAYVGAGDAIIDPDNGGLIPDSTGTLGRSLVRDPAIAGNFSYQDVNPILKDNWEINCKPYQSDTAPAVDGTIGRFTIGCSMREYIPNNGVTLTDQILYGIGVNVDGYYSYTIDGVDSLFERDSLNVYARDDDVIRLQKYGRHIYFVVEPGDTLISAVTAANPGVFTVTNHLLVVDEIITIQGATGMPEINGNWAVNSVIDADNFTLKHPITGVVLDTSAYGAYNANSASFTSDPFEYTETIPSDFYDVLSSPDWANGYGSTVVMVFGSDGVIVNEPSYYVRNTLRASDLAQTAVSWNKADDDLPNGILKYILGFNEDLQKEGANTFTWTGDNKIRAYGDTGIATVYLTVNGGKIEGYDGAIGRRAPIIGQIKATVGEPLVYFEAIEDFTSLGIERPTEINSFEIHFVSSTGSYIAYQGSASALLRIRKGET